MAFDYNSVWKDIYLCFGGKAYRLKHNYNEVVSLLGISYMSESKNKVLNIKGLGKIKVRDVEYRREHMRININCCRALN